MTETNENDETSADVAEQSNGSQEPPQFRFGNIARVVMPLILLGAVGVVFIGFFDGINMVVNLVNPPLVTATGQVIFKGEPIEGALLSTRHANSRIAGAIGWTDGKGRFSFKTDIDGYVEGLYAGEHQVIVTIADATAPATLGPPPNIAPEAYASFETTPLRIVVSRNAEENDFTLRIEGERPDRPSGGSSGRGFDPDEIVTRTFETYDKNKDSQLTADEIQEIEEDRAERIHRADANEDGIVEREELLQALSAPRPPMQPPNLD